jgi:hypothetical protein
MLSDDDGECLGCAEGLRRALRKKHAGSDGQAALFE